MHQPQCDLLWLWNCWRSTPHDCPTQFYVFRNLFHGGGGWGGGQGWGSRYGGEGGSWMWLTQGLINVQGGWVGMPPPLWPPPLNAPRLHVRMCHYSAIPELNIYIIWGSSGSYIQLMKIYRSKCFVSSSMILPWSAPITATLVFVTWPMSLYNIIYHVAVVSKGWGVWCLRLRLCGKVSVTVWKVNWGHTWKCSVIVGNKLLMKGKIFYIWAYGFLFG